MKYFFFYQNMYFLHGKITRRHRRKIVGKNGEILTCKNKVVMTIRSVKSLLEKCHYLTFLRDITFSRPLYPPKVTFWPFYNLAVRFTDNFIIKQCPYSQWEVEGGRDEPVPAAWPPG